MSAPAVTAHLHQVADDELYRRNAFRVAGVATDSGARALRERQKKEAAAAAVGVALATDARLPLEPAPDAEDVRAAHDVLADPRRRLVHELFWFWGEDTAACGCASHRRHDEAVEAHALALDAELAGEHGETWLAARERWAAVIDDPATWAHLRARVDALDDARRLDERAVDELRRETPRAVVATVVACAARAADPRRLREEAGFWPVPADVLDDLLLDAVADRVDRVEAALTGSRALLEADPGGAAGRLRPDVVDDLRWINRLAPHKRFRRLAELREDAAIVLNNAALAVMEKGGAKDRKRMIAVLVDAHDLATTEKTRSTVAANRDAAKRPAPPAAPSPRATAGDLGVLLQFALESGQHDLAAQVATLLLETETDPSRRAWLRGVAGERGRAGPAPAAGRRSAGWDLVMAGLAVALVVAVVGAVIVGAVMLVVHDPRFLILVGVGLGILALVLVARHSSDRDPFP